MSEPIVLAQEQPMVDRKRIGISYSGGGPLVVVELGIALAFVERGVIPDVIAGASAGSLAGAAHAIDPRGGTGIERAVQVLGAVRNRTLGLGIDQVAIRLLLEREHFTSVGDHSGLRRLVGEVLAGLGMGEVTVGTFKPPKYPLLEVVATNRLDGRSVWFPGPTPIADALLASSAIPGIFPWQMLRVGGRTLTLVDGGVVDNQPLSRLVTRRCGTIFACAVGYVGGSIPPPNNAIDNALQSLVIAIHQQTKLEEAYVRLRLGDAGVVHHIHPEVNVPVLGFDFNPELVAAVVEESRAKTVAWLIKLGF
ncbi:MAG TPA: patatin-like phospholipase family protein [Candidatus Dormibacteraeota bacterium]|jgi:NTE family protein|nr:patatin-like phospholipase family protein [Candidatus Dormibacteraeota bacterium]